ncbi:DNA cytosine methyltransferase [Paraglaciecola sp. 20A4]|uniref:DNA cytosine methyltransferase n=1 Tax=Paraglaciecola sp. 20A4 TaxID=2687288 RepID=UPI001408B5AC|nr:DNA cytosine methyltransferase [Paraglaciecola sp. 20A4]
MSSNFTAIDLFSGAGGFSLAAHSVGFNLLAAIEFDVNAANTCYQNLVQRLGASTQVFAQDINDVDIDGLMKYQGLKQGELDLLLGGPPCQGFSSHRIKDAGKDDPRNALLIRYFDFVERLKPKVFLLENVPGLLWQRHADYLAKFLKLAEEHDYQVITGAPLIINAKDYGVPQNRKRAFILALRRDISAEELIWPPKATHSQAGNNKWKTASTVFEKPTVEVLDGFRKRLIKKFDFTQDAAHKCIDNLVWGKPLEANDPCNVHMQHSEKMTSLFKETPLLGSRDESGRELACHKNYAGHKDVYGRIYPHLPSNTMTTGCNNPSKGRFVHPWLNHGTSLRHAARLQTFPDDYFFEGGIMSIAKQIGNAVPVELGKALINQIKIQVLDKNK